MSWNVVPGGLRPRWASTVLAAVTAFALALSTPVSAQEPDEPSDSTPRVTGNIEVTATRIPEDVETVPASITIIQGSELEARGVRDLPSALALAGGISIAPGGDGGPAGSVPEIWGLREFDAFLLVVDDVPWGGRLQPGLADPRPDQRRPHRGPARRGAGDVRRDLVRRRHPRHSS